MLATFYCSLAVLAAAATDAEASGKSDGFFPDVLSFLSGCGSADFDVCLARTIDDVMRENGTYRLNRYLTVELHRTENNLRRGDGKGGDQDYEDGEEDGAEPRTRDLVTRVLRFFNALRVQYRPEIVDRNFEGTPSTLNRLRLTIKRTITFQRRFMYNIRR